MATDSDEDADTGDDTGGGPEAEYDVSSEDRTWGILTHAAAFAGFGVPFGNVLGPLVIWLVKKEESQFVDENGKQAVNFQITWSILLVLALPTILIGIGVVLVPIIALSWLALVVVAMMRASEDQVYEYPLTVEFVS